MALRAVCWLLALLMLVAHAAARDVVLRDTIGCGADGEDCSSASTDGSPGNFAYTNQSTNWAAPGLRFTNTTADTIKLREARVVIAVYFNGGATNEIQLLDSKSIEFNLWTDGVEGTGDTYAQTPNGDVSSTHPNVIALSTPETLTAEALGVTGEGLTHTTYVLSADLTPYDLFVAPGEEVVYSFLRRLDTGADIDFRVLLSSEEHGEEDVFQASDSQPSLSPGYLETQLGYPAPNYAGFVSGSTLDGDYNSDGVVDAADFTRWRDRLLLPVSNPYDGADGDGDGVVDEDDYEVWAENYGLTLDTLGDDPGSAVMAPEPATLAIVAFAVASGSLARNVRPRGATPS